MSGGLDYATYAKRGIVFGFLLIGVGVAGGLFLPAVAGPLPGWERTLFLDSALVGILTEFVSVFGFGIVLPLLDA